MRPSAPGCAKNVSTTQLFLVYIEMGKSSLETMSGHNCDVNSARFFCCCYLSVTYMYLAFLTNNIEIKSLASSDMTSKLSSSKSHSTPVTLARVSLSSSPRSGDRPLSLQVNNYNIKYN